MKIGPVEGTAEEVNDFFQNNGLNPLDYFEVPDKKLSTIWLVLPCVVFIVCLTILSFVAGLTDKFKLYVFLVGFASGVWASVCVHVRFKNATVAGLVAFSGLLIMLVALGVLEPFQLLEYIKLDK